MRRMIGVSLGRILCVLRFIGPIGLVGCGSVAPAGPEVYGDGDGDSDGDTDGDGVLDFDPELCTCVNEDDVCYDQRYCERQGLMCNAVQSCPDGYECDTMTGSCVCSDVEVCGILCNEDRDCPDGAQCNLNSFVCEAPLRCVTDETCGDEEVCMVAYDWNDLRRCHPRTDYAAIGDPCFDTSDCDRGGVCVTEVCIQACRRNSDCPEGLVCTKAGSLDVGCTLPEWSTCGTSCDADEYCTTPGHVEPICEVNCTEQLECEIGRCKVDWHHPSWGRCDNSAAPCEPGEFGFSLDIMQDRCAIEQPCWSDRDCPAQYECYMPYFEYRTSFCSRDAPESF